MAPLVCPPADPFSAETVFERQVCEASGRLLATRLPPPDDAGIIPR